MIAEGYQLKGKLGGIRVSPDDGNCMACDTPKSVVHITFDWMIRETLSSRAYLTEVNISICQSCIQQIIDVCFDPGGNES